jgi:hypothetical protein
MFAGHLSLALSLSLLQLLVAEPVQTQSIAPVQTLAAEKVRTEFAKSSSPISRNSKAEKETIFATKVKADIARLGTGPAAHAEISLRDHRKLKGYISEVTEDSFTVVDNKSGDSTQVAYPQVKQVKGNNLSTGVKIAIGAGILIYLILVMKGIANGNG